MSWLSGRSTSFRAILFANAGSLSPRFAAVFALIVLTFCVLTTPIAARNSQPNCGKRQPAVASRILGGEESKEGRWPWHAAIYRQVRSQPSYTCGGSIIGKDTILTVAHCLVSTSRLVDVAQITVIVGRENLNEISDHQQAFNVSKLITHPEFKISSMAHDIAILKLSSDIRMTRFVQPVCLWSMDNGSNQIVGTTGTAVGFGKTEHEQTSGSLQEVPLTVVDFWTCLDNDRATYSHVLTRNVFCAGGGAQGASPCNGDNGGGMFYEVNGTWHLRGLVSFMVKRSNDDSCDPSKYTVLTEVSKYLEWVMLESTGLQTPKNAPQLEQCTESGIVRNQTLCNIAHRFEHDFLLVSLGYEINRVPLNGGRSVKIAEPDKLEGIDRDCAEGRIYWSNSDTRQILSMHYDGSDQKPFITEDIGSPKGVAVDWISRRLYWVDVEKRTIEVASTQNPSLRTVLNSKHVVDPRMIAVDPLTSKLYWFDWNDGEPKIEWANLDGTGRQLLVGSPQIAHVYGLQVSLASGELCYTDGRTHKLECIDPYTRHIRTIASNLTEPFGLAITKERFYWTNWMSEKIESINLDGGRRRKSIISPFNQNPLYEMTAVTDYCPMFYSPCFVFNGDCPENTICLLNPRSPSGKRCKCVRNCDENV